MSGIFKFVIRLGVIGVLLSVGAFALFGADRVGAFADQVRMNVTGMIDDCVDDPTVLRRQLQKLGKEYPKRIAQVRADLGQLSQQVRQLEHQKAVAERVVAIAKDDVHELEGQLAKVAAGEENGSRLASVTHRETGWYVERLERRAAQARQTRAVYMARAEDAGHDLGYLRQQGERLQEMLAKLESEFERFQTQMIQLDRQVDAVERNERLIKMIEKRQRSIEEMDRYESASVDQLRAQLAQKLVEQEARLEVLVDGTSQDDYEARALQSLEAPASKVEILLPGANDR